MKKILKISFFLLIANVSYCQMPVTDVAASTSLTAINASMNSSLVKAGTQIKLATDQYDLYKKNLDKLKKVAAVIQTGKLALAVVDNFSMIEQTIFSTSNNIKKINPKHRATWINSFNVLLDEVYVVSETSSIVVSNGPLEMTDSERLISLMEVYKMSNELKVKTSAFGRKVNQMLY